MPRAPVLLALLAGCAALAAGCGGKQVSREEYVQTLAAPLGRVDAALALMEAAPPEGLEAAALQARQGLLAAAGSIEAIEPPERLFEAHELLVAGIRGLAGEVEELARQSLSAEIPDVLDRIEQLPSVAKLQQAQELFAREDVTLEIGSESPPPTSVAAETG